VKNLQKWLIFAREQQGQTLSYICSAIMPNRVVRVSQVGLKTLAG